ncbi:hypothetical protein [Lichenihabitans psoromatis]|uniref:hypothetical protein n=1 Tax=Lichenihabitans psoromatis TaxID=2528642 RepID=UPI0010365EA1|nr:hypothetical protein [Lichenihabitans psoromatis]
MPNSNDFATSIDSVLLRVDLRCCGCLKPAMRLASVDRPPGAMKASTLFKRRKLWTRMVFSCPACAYEVANLDDVRDATALDIAQRERELRYARRPDPYPMLPLSPLMRYA